VEQIVSEYLSTHPAAAPNSGDYEVGSNRQLQASFQNGLVFESANGDFYVHVGGMTQFDTTGFSDDPQLNASPFVGGVGPIPDSVYFRRARLRIDGRMNDLIEWAAEYDFANAISTFNNLPGNPPGFPAQALTPGLTDLYARFLQLPFFGNLTIGNFKEPIGFEHLVNDRFLDFMERSYNQSVFYGPFNNGFSPGIMLSNWAVNERATWALWAGPNQSNPYGYHIGNNPFAFTGRITYLPIYDGDGRYLVHVGASTSTRSPDQGQFLARATGNILSGPPGPLNPVYATTGSLSASNQSLVNLEMASVWGPLTLQSEYCCEWVDNVSPNPNLFFTPAQQALMSSGTAFIQGWYTEALWFLTGESRTYDRRAGVFDRVIPLENSYWVRGAGGPPCFGRGAWQIAARYSGLDLNTAGINGGTLNSLTLGLNWFLTPNMKFQWNYDFTHRSQVATVGAGNINSFGMRLAMDF
jgi:phosphate-selective porin OprO/OprP